MYIRHINMIMSSMLWCILYIITLHYIIYYIFICILWTLQKNFPLRDNKVLLYCLIYRIRFEFYRGMFVIHLWLSHLTVYLDRWVAAHLSARQVRVVWRCDVVVWQRMLHVLTQPHRLVTINITDHMQTLSFHKWPRSYYQVYAVFPLLYDEWGGLFF